MTKPKVGEDIRQMLKKAEAYLIAFQNEEAQLILSKVLKIEPNNVEGLYLQGEALCKLGRISESAIVLKRADELKPNHPRIEHMLGWACFMNGEKEYGKTLILRALSKIPDDAQILCDLAVVENALGNSKKAEDYATKVLEANPDNELAKDVLKKILQFSKIRKNVYKKN